MHFAISWQLKSNLIICWLKPNGNECASSKTKSIAVAFKKLKKKPVNPSILQILIQIMCGNRKRPPS